MKKVILIKVYMLDRAQHNGFDTLSVQLLFFIFYLDSPCFSLHLEKRLHYP